MFPATPKPVNVQMANSNIQNLLTEIRACQHCADSLPLGPRPIVAASKSSRILIIGQAPGSKVHESGVPWDDPSGRRLREWMGISEQDFYNEKLVALVPMGFCYPGKGASGDLPPRPECAELWHERLLSELKAVELTLVIGQYAQQYVLQDRRKRTLTETVKCWKEFLPSQLPLPHPSPRNNIWLKKNAWFEKDVLPWLSGAIKKLK